MWSTPQRRLDDAGREYHIVSSTLTAPLTLHSRACSTACPSFCSNCWLYCAAHTVSYVCAHTAAVPAVHFELSARTFWAQESHRRAASDMLCTFLALSCCRCCWILRALMHMTRRVLPCSRLLRARTQPSSCSNGPCLSRGSSVVPVTGATFGGKCCVLQLAAPSAVPQHVFNSESWFMLQLRTPSTCFVRACRLLNTALRSSAWQCSCPACLCTTRWEASTRQPWTGVHLLQATALSSLAASAPGELREP
jgi:hypothetical protein